MNKMSQEHLVVANSKQVIEDCWGHIKRTEELTRKGSHILNMEQL